MNSLLSYPPAQVLALDSEHYIAIPRYRATEVTSSKHAGMSRFWRKLSLKGLISGIFSRGKKGNVGKANFQQLTGMEELYYSGDEGLDAAYQLVRFGVELPWTVLEKGRLLAMIEKRQSRWHVLGRCLLYSSELMALTAFIDASLCSTVKGGIIERWPEAVQEVIRQSENLYLVVCKPGICFETFKRFFPHIIPQLCNHDSATEFRVYSACFDHDFTVRII